MENTQTKDGQDDLPLTPEQLEEQLVKTKAELEQYKQANPEHRTQEAQKLDRVIKVSRDSSKFIELYETDPKMAKRVVEHNNKAFGENFTVEDYLEQIKDGKENPEDNILSKVEAKLEEREAKKVYKDFLKKKEIDEESEFGKDVIEIYEDLIEGKKKNSDNVEKYLKIALREAKRTSEFSDSYKKAIDDVQGIGSPKKGDQEPQRKSFVAKKASIFEYVDQRKK